MCVLPVFQSAVSYCSWESFKYLGEMFLYFSLLVILIGRAWCGWICPFGFLQDVLDLIRKKLNFGYLSFSEGVRAKLRCIKWIFLFVALLLPLWAAFPVLAPSVAAEFSCPFCQLCPGKYILPLVTADASRVAVNYRSETAFILTALGLLFSVLVIFGALMKRRFWCPYCPMGLLLSFYRKISFIKLKKDSGKCTMCEVCYNVCPLEIQQVFKERESEDVTFSDCTLCLKCVEHCPEDGALRATFLGKTLYSAKYEFSMPHSQRERTDE
ncbi:4Fe-4S binding domain protein [delta proteobacterium NaphS2]|nr:4Fe-4S binding domain protein [delta proteobacterium NaphS2]